MVKFKKGLCLLFMILCGGVLCLTPFLFGCDNKPATVEFEVVDVDTQTFYQSDDFSLNGGKLTIKNKSTNENTIINLSDVMIISGLPDMTTPGRKEIKIRYEEKDYTFYVNVLDRFSVIEKDSVLQGDYYQNDVFSLNGRTVRLKDNKTNETFVVNLNDEMLVGLVDMSVYGEQTVKFNYNDLSCSFNINILEKTDENIAQQIAAILNSFQDGSLQRINISASYNYSARFLNQHASDSQNYDITTITKEGYGMPHDDAGYQCLRAMFDTFANSIVKSTLEAGMVTNSLQTKIEVSYLMYLYYIAQETNAFDLLTDDFGEFCSELLKKDYIYTFLGTDLPTLFARKTGVLDADNFSRVTKQTLDKIKTNKSFEDFEFFTKTFVLLIDRLKANGDVLTKAIFSDSSFKESFLESAGRIDEMFVSGDFTEYYNVCLEIEENFRDAYERVVASNPQYANYDVEQTLGGIKNALETSDFSVKFIKFLTTDMGDVENAKDFFVKILKNEDFGQMFENFVANEINSCLTFGNEEFLNEIIEVLEDIKTNESFENFDLFERFYITQISDSLDVEEELKECYEIYLRAIDDFVKDENYLNFAKEILRTYNYSSAYALDSFGIGPIDALSGYPVISFAVVERTFSFFGYDYLNGNFDEVNTVNDLILILLNDEKNGQFFEDLIADYLTVLIAPQNLEEVNEAAHTVLDNVRLAGNFDGFDFFTRYYDIMFNNEIYDEDTKTFFSNTFASLDTFVKEGDYMALAVDVATNFKTWSEAVIAYGESPSIMIYYCEAVSELFLALINDETEGFNSFETFYNASIKDNDYVGELDKLEIKKIFLAIDQVVKDKDIDAFYEKLVDFLNYARDMELAPYPTILVKLSSNFVNIGRDLKTFLESQTPANLETLLNTVGEIFIRDAFYQEFGHGYYDYELNDFVVEYTDNLEEIENYIQKYKTYFVVPFVASITSENELDWSLFDMGTTVRIFYNCLAECRGMHLPETFENTMIRLLDINNENYLENLTSFESLSDMFMLFVLSSGDVNDAAEKISIMLYENFRKPNSVKSQFVSNCSQLLVELYDGIVNDDLNMEEFASEFTQFAETFLHDEFKTTLYAIFAAYIIYTADEGTDYNEVFSFIELPQGISINYNEMVRKIKDRTTFENAIKISNIETQVLSTQTEFVKEIVTITFDINIDVEIAEFSGQFVLKLELEK